MARSRENDSRKLLIRLRDTLAEPGSGQERLDKITHHIADSMGTEVCSVYLFRDADTLELCSSEGLNPEAVHKTRLRLGEGLVGRVARTGKTINSGNAPAEPGFRFLPETGEEVFASFLGVPIQRVGEKRGVLVVQSREARRFSEDEVYGLEVVAMVLAEMNDLGAFSGNGENNPASVRRFPVMLRGTTAQEGAALGQAWLHEPRVIITNPVADDPVLEKQRLSEAVQKLQERADRMIEESDNQGAHVEVLEAYRMFTRSKGWLRRMEEAIDLGLSAEAAAEKEQSQTRARLEMASDPYLRERLHDMDDLFYSLLKVLTGQGDGNDAEIPDAPILIARNIGPGELLAYGRRLKGVILEEGSFGSHATIVARSLGLPLIIHARRISAETLNGDTLILDGDTGTVHLRPEDSVIAAFTDKIAMQAEALNRYAGLRDLPATTLCGTRIELFMNAGLLGDLPSLYESGAEGVGLFRTELQFLTRTTIPRRKELAKSYRHVLDSAKNRPVMFRTLDIGSDKVLPYMKPQDEPNPAMGWRAIRVGLDKPGVLKMQLQALIRASVGRPLYVMFPFIAEIGEFEAAYRILMEQVKREREMGHEMPLDIRVGAMLETPSIAFAPDRFFEMCDFVSIGGNDLKQFFFAADRENERVRMRYDLLDSSFLALISMIIERCAAARVPLSYCGEDAGRLPEAITLTALGIRRLSMRPASIGPVKELIRLSDIGELRAKIDEGRKAGQPNFRKIVTDFIARARSQG